MNKVKFAVLRFVTDYKIKEYSSKELLRALENMGYAVTELENQNEKILLIDAKQNFFIFDNGTVKYVALPYGLSEEEKCFTLLTALCEIYVSRNRLLPKGAIPEDFATELVKHLSNKSVFSHIKCHFFEYVSALILLIITLCFSLTAIFLEKNLDKKITLPDFEHTNQLSAFDLEENENKEIISVFNSIDIPSQNDLGISSIIDNNISDFESDMQIVSDDSTTVYYVTKSGNKYHIDTCSYIKDLSECTSMTLAQMDNKYTPCKRCIK